jgi:hypothetical protein
MEQLVVAGTVLISLSLRCLSLSVEFNRLRAELENHIVQSNSQPAREIESARIQSKDLERAVAGLSLEHHEIKGTVLQLSDRLSKVIAQGKANHSRLEALEKSSQASMEAMEKSHRECKATIEALEKSSQAQDAQSRVHDALRGVLLYARDVVLPSQVHADLRSQLLDPSVLPSEGDLGECILRGLDPSDPTDDADRQRQLAAEGVVQRAGLDAGFMVELGYIAGERSGNSRALDRRAFNNPPVMLQQLTDLKAWATTWTEATTEEQELKQNTLTTVERLRRFTRSKSTK